MRCALADMARTHGWRLNKYPTTPEGRRIFPGYYKTHREAKPAKPRAKKAKKSLDAYLADRERFGFAT